MSVTFSGAFTFSGGGFTASLAPSVATAGWYGGGQVGPSIISTVNRMTFATDTATASVRGPLSLGRRGISGAGTLSAGWFAGGYMDPSPRSTVDRITYATDTDTASIRGPLAIARYAGTATGDTSYGWYIGGNNSDYAPPQLSQVDRITYATDTATASSRGPLTTAVAYTASVTDSTYGWIGAGSVGTGPGIISTVQRITFATDTDTASVRGPLVATRTSHTGTCDNTYGWFAAGYVNASPTSSVTRITFATDTATSTDRGYLTDAFERQGSSSGLQ